MHILVTAATGTVGSQVVAELQTRGATVRAFVRDRDKARCVLGPDVELAVGDFADTGALTRAMRDVDRVFLACSNAPGQVDHEGSVVDAARSAGVAGVVKLSGPRADADSMLVFERWHAAIEQRLRASGIPAVVLRPSTYMSNLLASAPGVARSGMLFAPADDARIAFVDPGDVAAVAATVLLDARHDGHTYRLTGPAAISYGQIAEDLSTATGRPVAYVDVSDTAARAAMLDDGLPPFAADAIIDIFRAQRAGEMSQVSTDVRTLLGRDATPFAKFAQAHAPAFAAVAV